MTKWRYERRVFDRLRRDCSAEAKTGYEQSIQMLLERYNTTIYENRFIVGGAVEVFTYALLRLVGIDCILYGDQSMAGDILLPNRRQISVKCNFVGAKSIRLLNQMGEGPRTWDTATLFIIANVGIVFGAPDMVDPTHIKRTGDAVVLTTPGMRSLISNKNNVLEMNIAKKPPTEITGFSQKASTAVAYQIMRDIENSTLLSAYLSDKKSNT